MATGWSWVRIQRRQLRFGTLAIIPFTPLFQKSLVLISGVYARGRGAYLCFPVPMFPGTDVPRTYVPRCLCSPVPMFPGTDVFLGFCTLIVVISINRLQILPIPWYDSRLGLCLGFRFRVLVRVIRVRVRLELQTVFRY